MIAALVLLSLAIAWRLTLGMGHRDDFSWLHNFSPFASIVLCGAFFVPRLYAVLLPLVALFITDMEINHYYEFPLVTWEMGMRYVVLAGVGLFGWYLRGQSRSWIVLGASAVSSVAFYFLTNTTSWLTDPNYAKTFEGWAQALTGGVPGYPPTLVFFRNSLVSDVIFTGIFLLALRVTRAFPAPAALPTTESARWA